MSNLKHAKLGLANSGQPNFKPKAKAPLGKIVDSAKVKKFVDIDAKMKKLKIERDELELFLKETGVDFIIEHNVQSDEVVSSVKLADDGDDGAAVVTVTLKNAYAVVSPTEAEELAEALESDVNELFQFVAVPTFDSKAFFKADGSFNVTAYRRFMKAANAAVKALRDEGLLDAGKDVLTESVAVQVKPDFHDRRWLMDAVANELIHDRLKTQVAIKAG